MATARAKVVRRFSDAEAFQTANGWYVTTKLFRDGFVTYLGSSINRESWAWADAWRMIRGWEKKS